MSAPLKKGTICTNSKPGVLFWYLFYSEWKERNISSQMILTNGRAVQKNHSYKITLCWKNNAIAGKLQSITAQRKFKSFAPALRLESTAILADMCWLILKLGTQACISITSTCTLSDFCLLMRHINTWKNINSQRLTLTLIVNSQYIFRPTNSNNTLAKRLLY